MWEIGDEAKLEIDGSPDRIAAICGGAYLETALTEGLRSHLVGDQKAWDRMFSFTGPLATFEAKIRIAYMTSMITDDFQHDMLILKDIRNKFAHDLTTSSFDIDQFRDRLRNLKSVNVGILAIEFVESRAATPRERFLSAVGEASHLLVSWRRPPHEFEPLGTPLAAHAPSPDKSR